MGMPQAARRWTAELVRALPDDGNRYEVIAGELMEFEARVIERWRPGDERPEILAETITWPCEAGVAPLVIDLPEYFAEVLDER